MRMPRIYICVEGDADRIEIVEPVKGSGAEAVQDAIGLAVHRILHAIWPTGAEPAHWRVADALVDTENDRAR